MPLATDDLRIGLWIAIHAIRPPEEKTPDMPDMGFVMVQAHMQPRQPKPWEKYVVDGLPYMVLSINLPYVIAWDGVCDRITCLDTRYLDLMALSQDYVHAIMNCDKTSSYLVPTHLPKDVYGMSNSRQANRTKWIEREKKKKESAKQKAMQAFYPPQHRQMKVEIIQSPSPDNDDDEDGNPII
jgi:hypothetical protein